MSGQFNALFCYARILTKATNNSVVMFLLVQARGIQLSWSGACFSTKM